MNKCPSRDHVEKVKPDDEYTVVVRFRKKISPMIADAANQVRALLPTNREKLRRTYVQLAGIEYTKTLLKLHYNFFYRVTEGEDKP